MNTFKKIIDVFSTVMLVIFILLVILLVGVRIVGLEPHIVLSGSMEPEILTGSLVYVSRVTPEEACELKAGDTVTFLTDHNGTKVTHKIYEVVGPAYVKNQYGEQVLDENGDPIVAKDDNGYPIVMYTTYGINNKNESSSSGYTLDGELGEGNLASSNVFGTPLFSIPYLGYVAHFVQNPPGKYIAIAFCVFLIINTFVFGVDKKKRGDNSPEENEAVDNAEAVGNGDEESQSKQ